MAQPVWVTPAGNLGTIAESLYFHRPIEAYDPDGPAITYGLIAGNLPEGVQVTVNGSIEGVPLAYARIKGVPAEVAENVTSSFAIRATSTDGQINDRTFSLTVTGQDIPQFTTPAGSLGTFFDGDVINLSIVFDDQDPGDVAVISVDIGELPPGLRLNPLTGAITGYILPITNLPDDATAGFDSSEFDLYPYSFSTRSINKTYEFTLKITDGKDQNLRTFSMYVVSRDSLTADTTDFTADSDTLTADLSPYRTPLITNYPEDGVIGTFRHDNFFAYQIDGLDLDGDPFEFEIEQGDSSDIPPGIAFDRNTGWLTGFFPDQGATELTYNFAITIYKKDDTSIVSTPYAYTMTVIGSIESSVIWLNGTLIAGRPAGDPIYSLGAINNGATSMFAILASNPSGRVLQYKLKPGSYPNTPGQYNLLPQGLQLLNDGSISGRVSFNTFTIDSGTTTFDKDITTRLANNETRFDKAFDFTVIAYSSDGLVSVSRKFRITVDRKYNTPYQGLYIKAMPSHVDRNLVNTLLQNQDIIQPSSIYRPADPYFGIAKNVTFTQAYSLDTATLDEYLLALSKNHFRKKVILGGVKTAQALNADGTVAYEVVYSNIVDTGVNKLGKSAAQSITWPVDIPAINNIVYPNSLVNMRNQVVDVIGQQSTVLPLWMTTKQTDGRVLGFTKAWVICYTLPGESNRISYNIRTQFGEILNQVNFEVDRYILDNQLTKNWVNNDWNPSPPISTTFNENQTTHTTVSGDATTFDGDSLEFTAPVDMYGKTDEYDKYLVFPKTNILG